MLDDLGRPIRFMKPGQEDDFGVITLRCINEPTDSAVSDRPFSTPSPDDAMQQNRLTDADLRDQLESAMRHTCKRADESWQDCIDRLCFEHMVGIRPPPKNEDK